MSDNPLCPECGAKLVEYKHGLAKGLVRGLWKLGKGGLGPQEIASIGLSKGEYTNFAKLAYWDLVKKISDDSGKGGRWQLTRQGQAWLAGEIRLQRFCWVYRKVVQRYEGPWLSIDDVTGGYKYKPEYAREAVPHR